MGWDLGVGPSTLMLDIPINKVTYSFCEAIMASNEKPLVSICTHVVGLQLGDVRCFRLPPSLCQEGLLNTIFDEIGIIPMKMES
jgi:hypothetical protein